ncbi:hypothetical protein [Actinomadura rugatobispora]|uniref:WD40 repeat domain-containing protein n=1 Tax=Actinomadura rugatobispora TaxID=1994 RepID=A0ABW1A7V3_9ACTN|nr:hypothetical protein GCM10010200_045340 [Actinomadura rugatobispora]
MTDEMREALKGTLKAASLNAPEVAPDLLDRLADRHRARRRRRATSAVAAVAAVAVAAGGTTLVLRPGGDAGPEPLKRPTPLTTATLPKPVPVPEGAVRTLPKTLPNGREYRPKVALSGTALLVSTESSLQVTDRLWVYDLRTRAATKVTDVVVPSGSKIYASYFAVGDGQVAWWLQRRSGARMMTEIWTAPLAGGTARKVLALDAASDEGRSIGRLVVGAGKIRWGPNDFMPQAGTAVYEAPLTGGRAQRIPGTEGSRILAWPWVGTPGGTSGRVDEASFKRLRNMDTGETRDAELPKGKASWTCGITWCLGGQAAGVTYTGGAPDSYALRRDGKAGHVFKMRDLDLFPGADPLYDRFLPQLVAATSQGKKLARNAMLYDLATEKLIDLGPNKGGAVPGTIANAWQGGTGPGLDRYIVRETADGSFQMVDLAALS